MFLKYVKGIESLEKLVNSGNWKLAVIKFQPGITELSCPIPEYNLKCLRHLALKFNRSDSMIKSH